jgi:hypothetical protein
VINEHGPKRPDHTLGTGTITIPKDAREASSSGSSYDTALVVYPNEGEAPISDAGKETNYAWIACAEGQKVRGNIASSNFSDRTTLYVELKRAVDTETGKSVRLVGQLRDRIPYQKVLCQSYL